MAATLPGNIRNASGRSRSTRAAAFSIAGNIDGAITTDRQTAGKIHRASGADGQVGSEHVLLLRVQIHRTQLVGAVIEHQDASILVERQPFWLGESAA